AADLNLNDRHRPAPLTLGAGLTDADDRDETSAPCCQRLGPNIGIGLATGVAALGMADDRMAATGILQHLGADTAGEGALRLGMTVLSAQRNIAAGERLADHGE